MFAVFMNNNTTKKDNANISRKEKR